MSLIHTNEKKKVESCWRFYYGLKQGALQGGKINKAEQPASPDTAGGDDNDNIDVKKYFY